MRNLLEEKLKLPTDGLAPVKHQLKNIVLEVRSHTPRRRSPPPHVQRKRTQCSCLGGVLVHDNNVAVTQQLTDKPNSSHVRQRHASGGTTWATAWR